MTENEADRLRIQQFREHQTQQQQARCNEINRLRRSAPVILERVAFNYDRVLDYYTYNSVADGP